VEFEDRVRNPRQRKDKIDRAGQDRASRHAVEGSLVRILRDNEAALFLDGFQAEAAISACSREDHADGAFSILLRQ
jgi:hypothetical protein